ncbi:MAG: orotidine-5'-phosphate decarboxylase [Candidatus Sumerlaeia bacterium]|nr:orotidine-5'-phosphate decarboxylase [Candidatus Sumerlaeia bacterium]
MSESFLERLKEAMRKNQTALCVGLDLDRKLMPRHFHDDFDQAEAFLSAIVEVTRNFACCYKINTAYYEVHGAMGWHLLDRIRALIPRELPVVLDAKRGDVGHTAELYARALFDTHRADAVTVNPMMGSDTLAPFLAHRDRGVFVLCATSNPGADEFLLGTGLYRKIAATWSEWAAINPNTGLVAGATRPSLLAEIRALAPGAPILLPGVGAQGGDARASLEAAASPTGPVIVAASRSVLYASRGEDFATAARKEAQLLKELTAPYVPSS